SRSPNSRGATVSYSTNSMPSIPRGLLDAGLVSREVMSHLLAGGSALLRLARDFDDHSQRRGVRAPTQSLDGAVRDRSDHRAMAPLLSRRDVGQVNLYDGKRHCGDRVVEGDPVVSDSGGIDDGTIGLVHVRMQRVDEDALVVRLHDDQLGAELARQRFEPGIDVRER